MMAAIYRPFHQKFPNVNLIVHGMTGATVQEEVLKGKLDIGMSPCDGERDPRLNYQIVAEIPMYVIVSAEDPVNEFFRRGSISQPVDIGHFMDHKFLYGPADSLERIAVERVFAESGHTPEDYEEVEGLHYRVAMVEEDHCYTITGAHHVRDLPENVRAYRLNTGVRIYFAVLTKKNIHISKYGDEVIEAIRKYWQQRVLPDGQI
jgi:DNA-binding transcriptional LysR family regulator